MAAHLKALPPEGDEFFRWLRRSSEEGWARATIDGSLYGYQFQQGTRWNPGLSEEEIHSYEREMGFAFPNEYRTFLRHMNGTDKQTLNVYGESGEPYRYGVAAYYAYPRDLGAVKEIIHWIYASCGIDREFVEAKQIPHVMPITRHRCLVIDRCDTNPVLSMYGKDIILYASSLRTFLIKDIFEGGDSEWPEEPWGPREPIAVKYWLEPHS